ATGENGLGSGTAGQDVAGTINGETASGSGQILTGKAGNAHTEGLILQITSTTTGDHGRVVLSRGVGGGLNSLIDQLTDSSDSVLSGAEDTLQKQMDDIDTEITRSQEQLSRYQDRLREQFDAMESILSTLKNQSSQLSAQIASLSGTSSTTSS
ncbi:MAG TPA: flagellar filament capping protein FliD, partial [Armatimonadota bacterium]|nr:flagellar filament capping protein FliD [Armatimonadota bacterium]